MNLNDENKLQSFFISNRGSSSVLVILIMVMLVVLGLLALMSTWSELKLARKNASWSTVYYSLDSKAEICLAEIDTCLLDAEESADNYIMTKDYERPESSYLPSNLQQAVHDGWQAAQSSGDEAKFVDSLYEKLYYSYCVIRLDELANIEFEIKSELDFKAGTQVFFTDAHIPENDAVRVFTTVHEDPTQDGRNLLVGIALQAGSSGSESGSERYRIVSWKEIPKPFEYEDALDFEEMEIGDTEFGDMELEGMELEDMEIGELEIDEPEIGEMEIDEMEIDEPEVD